MRKRKKHPTLASDPHTQIGKHTRVSTHIHTHMCQHMHIHLHLYV